MSEVLEVANEIIDHINGKTGDLTVEEALMVLCYVAEHCKAHEQTILAHEYHRALYRPREDE